MFLWDDARYFLAVHRLRSLSEAGRHLGVNQSTVGRRIRALEREFEAVLFVHTSDGYFLSPAGERLLARAEQMEDAAFALEREASGRQEALRGVVRITGPDALSTRVLIPILRQLKDQRPGIDFELVAENRTLSLTKREADMAVRTFRPQEHALVSRRICELGSSLYASTEYLARHGMHERDYSGHEFVSADEPSWAENQWLRRVCPTAHLSMKTNSTPAQLAATHAGMGIGILPCYIGDAEPGLVRVTQERVVVRSVWITLHRDLQHAGRVRACADAVTEGLLLHAAALAGVAGDLTRRGGGKKKRREA